LVRPGFILGCDVKTKKLVKKALKHPELYTPAEISFFDRWLRKKKEDKKTAKIKKQKEQQVNGN
jgi:hypothetical protein